MNRIESARHQSTPPTNNSPTPRRRRAAVAVVLGTVLIGSLLTGAPASAVEVAPTSTQACSDQGTHYVVSNKQDLFIGLGTKFKSGPGGTAHASVQSSLSTSTTVSISGGATISGVVAQFNTTFGLSATISASVSSTWSYDHPIATGKYGTLQFGNWGWKSTLRKYVVNSSCSVTSDVTGTISQIPSIDTWGYRYTETSS